MKCRGVTTHINFSPQLSDVIVMTLEQIRKNVTTDIFHLIPWLRNINLFLWLYQNLKDLWRVWNFYSISPLTLKPWWGLVQGHPETPRIILQYSSGRFKISIQFNSLYAMSQPHKGHLTSKLSCRRFPFYLLWTLLLFPFLLIRCTLPDFSCVSSLASLPFLPCCHHNNNKMLWGLRLWEVCWQSSSLKVRPRHRSRLVAHV